MQKDRFYALIAIAMLTTAVLVSYGAPRLEPDRPQPVPVENFPRQIGEWKTLKDVPLDSKVQKVLPTAHIVNRLYAHPRKGLVELLLLTASEVDDYHDPRVCFPNQGWQIQKEHQEQVGSQKVNAMLVTQERQQLDVFFWWVANKSAGPKSGVAGRLQKLRQELVRGESTSLFVRLVAPRNSLGKSGIEEFSRQIQSSLEALTRNLDVKSELR